MAEEKLQTLPASLREKQRYIIFEILAERDRELGQVVEAVWDSVLEFLGQEGAARADPWVIKDLFDREKQRGGIRVNRGMVEEVRASLALVTEVGGEEAAFHVLGVTGTMESARDKYF